MNNMSQCTKLSCAVCRLFSAAIPNWPPKKVRNTKPAISNHERFRSLFLSTRDAQTQHFVSHDYLRIPSMARDAQRNELAEDLLGNSVSIDISQQRLGSQTRGIIRRQHRQFEPLQFEFSSSPWISFLDTRNPLALFPSPPDSQHETPIHNSDNHHVF